MPDGRPGLKSALLGWALLAAAVIVTRSGAPRGFGIALAIAAATIFLARLSQRLVRLRLVRAPPPSSIPPLPPLEPVGTFEPRLPAEQATGYISYTEGFSAEGTLLALLRDRFDHEPARIAAVGFSGGYLARRLGSPWPWSAEAGADVALPVEPETVLGWLSELHNRYPDNALSDSRTVVGALRVRAEGYAEGRSAALGLAEREFRIALNAGEPLDWTERNARMDAFREQKDLDPDQTTALLAAASRAGAALAEAHASTPGAD